MTGNIGQTEYQQAIALAIADPLLAIVALNTSTGNQPDIAVAVLEEIGYSSDQSAFLIERGPIALCQYLIGGANLQGSDTKRRCNTQDEGQQVDKPDHDRMMLIEAHLNNILCNERNL